MVDTSLVVNYLPILYFDNKEPFMPLAVGFSLHRFDGPAASADHHIFLRDADCAIEYAIWFDWDIQHLYELEHVWVYLDRAREVVRVEASAHGGVREMWVDAGMLPLVGNRVVLYAEPGKHALHPRAKDMDKGRELTTQSCRDFAGRDTILTPILLDGALDELSIFDHHIAKNFLQQTAFRPDYRFNISVDLQSLQLFDWPDLKASIAGRVQAELDRLRGGYTGIKAVFLDSGDTLIDEGSQVFGEGELVLDAVAIPGGDQLVAKLKAQGYLVALVADGLRQSFVNVHGKLGFWHLFDARAISELVGVAKPDSRMFSVAARQLGLTPDDYCDCVMVGNNLERDIAGANRLGIRSVWLNWTSRYPTKPANSDEVPSVTISKPLELLDVLADMNANSARITGRNT